MLTRSWTCTDLCGTGRPLFFAANVPAKPCRRDIRKCRASSDSENPLHVLRVTKDPLQRAKLITALDTRWSAAAAAYVPTDVETFLAKELGVWKDTVMQFAVANPDIVSLSVAEAVKPSIKALKAANMPPEDIWFLVTKRPRLLSAPIPLQRWLEFLSAYGRLGSRLNPRDVQNFLLRAPDQLMEGTTLYAAGQVVSFLKTLGIPDDFLAQRVLCVWPAVLGRDVEGELRPVVTFLMSLGIEVTDISHIICAWPDVLLCDVTTHLKPWADHLRSELGCDATQVAEVIMTCPHLLGFPARDVFKSHIASLAKLGITRDDMKTMNRRSTRWLTAPGGTSQQVDFLIGPAGFTQEQARQLVVAAPGVLAEKEFELQRKWEWLQSVMGAGPSDVLACPSAMALGLTQVLGPRHGFLDKQGKLSQLDQPASPTSAARQLPPGSTALPEALAEVEATAAEAGPTVSISGRRLAALCQPAQDMEWCLSQGLSALDYAKYRAHWEEEYTTGLVRSAAQEFQDELKKLGIYEGE